MTASKHTEAPEADLTQSSLCLSHNMSSVEEMKVEGRSQSDGRRSSQSGLSDDHNEKCVNNTINNHSVMFWVTHHFL